MSYAFTDKGRMEVEHFIAECEAKRKEILDAGIDTNSRNHIPTSQDILNEINCDGLDVNGEYFGVWGVTDNYLAPPITLVLGEDLVKKVMEV